MIKNFKNFKEIKEKLQNIFSKSDSNNESNDKLKKRQSNITLVIAGGILLTLLFAINYVQSKAVKKSESKEEQDTNSKLELGVSSLDKDKMWRNHFEDNLRKNKQIFEDKLNKIDSDFQEQKQEITDNTKQEMLTLKTELDLAKNELRSAAMELERVAGLLENREKPEEEQDQGKISIVQIEKQKEFDRPKDANLYIPETSYVSGVLVGGIAVSTGINAPDENTTPVVIRLIGRGNLPRGFKTDVSNCRILGSSYGDLSSERAIIRAEKMVCIDKKTNLVTTSDIAGTVHGSDGMNGIKGQVIATSSKHIKNAMIGGVISGLSQSAKGQDGLNITSGGALSTAKKGVGKMAGEGILSGTSSAAEKISDYYLRLAESMSPILTIPGGARVDIVFLKGFYIGELGTHKKIEQERKVNKVELSDEDE